MRRTVGIAVAGAALCLCALSVSAAQNDYSGTWVLDKGSVKAVPKGFAHYTMTIKQDGNQLVVTVQPGGAADAGEQGPGSNGTLQALQNEANAQSQGSKSANGGLVRSGGTMGDATPGGNGPGSLAMQTAPSQATYNLDGRKTTDHVSGFGDVQLTAKWSKGGKSLDLSIAFQESSDGQTHLALNSKERWTLSEDGQTLKVQRTVSTPSTSDTVVFTLRKKSAP